MKVVIVGAGPGGLVSLTNFQRLFNPGELEIICYERRDRVGGLWVPTTDLEDKIDKNGVPMRTSIYDELKMNTPSILYPPYPEHKFPRGTSLYPTTEEMYKYWKSLSEKYNLEQYIKFNKMVSGISFNKESSKFSMKIHDMNSDDVKEETCDYVLLCSGQFILPRKPEIDMSKFTGESFHYHELRNPKRMYGKRILVVGSSWGAMDMAIMLNKPGRAKSMHLCYRNVRPVFESGAKFASIHQWLTSAEGNSVYFKDGTSIDVDAVIFCVGYVPFHPLAADLQLNFEVNPLSRFLHPLYKDLVHPKCPRLFFTGKPPVSGMFVVHPQVILISKIMKGEFNLPSQAEMEADIAKFDRYWTKELLTPYTEEELDTYFPLVELELAICNFPHELCSDVPKMGPEDLHELYYQIFWGVRHDCLNYKEYIHYMKPDPKNPKRMISVLAPPPEM